jgi:hypothetical protein
MTHPTIAFDESGWSGQDLLNDASPIYVLASVSIAEDRADALLRPIASKQAPEVKFSHARHPSRRGGLKQLLSSEIISSEHVKTTFYHKRYMAVAKMVDLLIEPMFYDQGISLYDRDVAPVIANMWHFAMPTLMGSASYDILLTKFIRLMRERIPDARADFYLYVDQARSDVTAEQAKEMLTMLSETSGHDDIALADFLLTAVDPSIPAFVELASMWTAQFDAPFQIIHDRSKPLKQEAALIDQITAKSQHDASFIVPRGDYSHKFPLLVNLPIQFEDSRKFKALQLCDVIAGAVAHWIGAQYSGVTDELSTLIAESRVPATIVSALWPDPTLSVSEPGAEERGGEAVVQSMMNLMDSQQNP